MNKITVFDVIFLSFMKSFSKLKLQTLELLGLREKDMEVYTALLQLGSAPLRGVAEQAGLNRGTAYDALKRLKASGLVSHVDAKSHRYFMAEDPGKLTGLVTRREVALQEVRQTLTDVIPALQSLTLEQNHRPSVRYYEGASGIRDILQDVLLTTEKIESRTYCVYSSSVIRDLIAAAWPRFVSQRKRRDVYVKAIAVGKGGTTAGKDERKWLTKKTSAPTYIFIYGNKTAYVAADASKRLFGVIIEDDAIAKTQQLIFESLWKSLD